MEWCLEVYFSRCYDESPPTDPRGPLAGRDHAIRGGAWFSQPRELRASDRDHGPAKHRDDGPGFRCVLAP